MPSWYIAGNERMRGPVLAGAVAATTTWNSADKGPNLVLSNGDLTISPSNDTDNAIRSIVSASTGKKYWEITVGNVDTAATTSEGIGTSSASLTNYVGSSAESTGWTGGGPVYKAAAQIAVVEAWTTGDVLCFALDIGGALIWFRKNAGNWNNDAGANPATGANGIDISTMSAPPWFAMGFARADVDSFTANFGGSAYAQTPPSGFGNW
jgi:hypothetical protein